jgi:hypothetical protein
MRSSPCHFLLDLPHTLALRVNYLYLANSRAGGLAFKTPVVTYKCNALWA